MPPTATLKIKYCGRSKGNDDNFSSCQIKELLVVNKPDQFIWSPDETENMKSGTELTGVKRKSIGSAGMAF